MTPLRRPTSRSPRCWRPCCRSSPAAAPRGNDRAREYIPDMARGPAYKAFAPNAGDARRASRCRRRSPGRSRAATTPFHYGPGEEEAARAGPRAGEPAAAHRRRRSRTGAASTRPTASSATARAARATARWSSPARSRRRPRTPPSACAPFPPGRIFHVVTMGTQMLYAARRRWKMPSYAALLTPERDAGRSVALRRPRTLQERAAARP